ncbi:hypothetical protein L7F22_040859 [Adiantum nelumboides]|nr:hypothetical protein [Adiantum nelumboides]
MNSTWYHRQAWGRKPDGPAIPMLLTNEDTNVHVLTLNSQYTAPAATLPTLLRRLWEPLQECLPILSYLRRNRAAIAAECNNSEDADDETTLQPASFHSTHSFSVQSAPRISPIVQSTLALSSSVHCTPTHSAARHQHSKQVQQHVVCAQQPICEHAAHQQPAHPHQQTEQEMQLHDSCGQKAQQSQQSPLFQEHAALGLEAYQQPAVASLQSHATCAPQMQQQMAQQQRMPQPAPCEP